MKKLWLFILWLCALVFTWNFSIANNEYEFTNLNISANILEDWTIKVTEKIVAGEIRVEAEAGTCNDAVIGSDTPIVTRSTSTGETCTAQWAAGAVLVIKANATNIGSFNLYLNGRAGGQYGTANIDDLAACIEVKFNGAALTLSGGISGRTFTDYLLGAVTTKIGENIIEIKSIGDEDTAPNIDFIKLVPVA